MTSRPSDRQAAVPDKQISATSSGDHKSNSETDQSFGEYVSGLNRKIFAAGVLFTDGTDRVLLVEPSYKSDWEIPGGVVEADEAPWTAAYRECDEELGLQVEIGRLLVVDYVPGVGERPESIKFIFDGGVLSESDLAGIALAPDEVLSVGFYTADEIHKKLERGVAARVLTALDALKTGQTALCTNGDSVL